MLPLVVREIMFEDRRCTWVRLSDTGRRGIREAARLFLQSGRVQRALDTALCPGQWDNEAACVLASAACDRTLRRFRHAYGDMATLEYPLVPDYVPPDIKHAWAVLAARP